MTKRWALATAGAVLLLGALAASCGSDDPASSAADRTTTSVAAGADGDDTALGNGTVTVDGVAYTFDVFSCAEVNGTPHLGGEGDANVAMSGAAFIVQVGGESGTSYTVRDPQVSLDGDTVTASGQGSDLSKSAMATIELTATCSRF